MSPSIGVRLEGFGATLVLSVALAACGGSPAASESPSSRVAVPTATGGTATPSGSMSAMAARWFELDLPPGMAWAPADGDQEAEAAAALEELGQAELTGVAVRTLTWKGRPGATVMVYSLSQSWAEEADAEQLAASAARLLGEELPPSSEIHGRTVWAIPHDPIGVAVWLDGQFWVYLVAGSPVAADGLVDLILGHGASPSGSPTVDASCPVVEFPHQDDELEALLPAEVLGKPMLRYAMRGHCVLAYMTDPEAVEGIEAEALALGVDVGALAHGVAGRNDPSDPPSFVHVMRAPTAQTEFSFAFLLFTVRIGYLDPFGVADEDYEVASIGGKQVMVGTPDMLQQDLHQQGIPYLYDTGDLVFIVVTDDPAWAEAALRQLP